MESSVGCLVAILLVVVIAAIVSSNRRKEMLRARKAYLEKLDALKADPHNPNLKQETLALGRVYSNLTRQRKGVTIFDEIALMNDLAAATAAAHSISRPDLAAPVGAAGPTLEDRLAKLTSLKQQGLITNDEYQSRRSEILRDI